MNCSQMGGDTNSKNVSGSGFAMPAGMRLRYDQPAPNLAEYVTGYTVYAADDPAPMINWYLPGPAMISVLVDAGPVTVSVHNAEFGPLDRVSLYGPTSRAIRTQTNGGITVSIGISALGWARMTRRPAVEFHNRIVPLSQLMGPMLSADLRDGLDALNNDAGIKPLLDRILAPWFQYPHTREDVIRAFSAFCVTEGVIEAKDVAEQLDVTTYDLRRIAGRHFGMCPKMLLRRARFLHSFIRLITADGLADYSSIGSSYFDVPHFLRDADKFLGTTPRRFLKLETTFFRAGLRPRTAVLGSPIEALHCPPLRSLPGWGGVSTEYNVL
jgi:hypothetical protein